MRLVGPLRARRLSPLLLVAMALFSTGALGALGWLVWQKDAELAATRRGERFDQAASAFAAAVQPVLLSVGSNGAPVEGAVPGGAMLLGVHAESVSVSRGALLYYPYEPRPETPFVESVFRAGERLEFADRDFAGAAARYGDLLQHPDDAVRAGARGRLARVQRKLGAPDEALTHYAVLAAAEHESVDGFPAALYARLGTVSALAEARRRSDLVREAQALASDLMSARWRLSKSEYTQRMAEVADWLESPPLPEPDRVAHAEVVGWLWHRRSTLPDASHQAIDIPSANGAALVAWSRRGDVLQAAVAGPTHLAAIDAELRVEASSRRLLLGSASVAVAFVLAAGWLLILRSLARERRLLQLQTDFVSAVSHEFRTPLTSMAHLAEMLESGRVSSGDAQRASYGVLVRDTNRLRRLVDDLLDFRRLESGSTPLRLERVDLVDLVQAVVSEFLAAIAGTSYHVEVSTPSTRLQVLADREALARALWNLLDNAIKYSPDCRTVWLEVGRAPGRVDISVRDKGLGIPAREQGRIFDRFVRGAEPKARRIKGTGIGLSLVRHIVRAHGGDVSVASQPGRGSCFTIHLPETAGAES